MTSEQAAEQFQPVARPRRRTLWAVVIAGVGLAFVAFVAWSWYDSVQSSRYNRTLARMRTLSTAYDEWAIKHNRLAAGVSLDELQPLAGGKLVTADEWGTPFAIEFSKTGYVIVSAGADRKFEAQARTYFAADQRFVHTKDLTKDIVLVDGTIIRGRGIGGDDHD